MTQQDYRAILEPSLGRPVFQGIKGEYRIVISRCADEADGVDPIEFRVLLPGDDLAVPLAHVLIERMRQQQKWGSQYHDPFTWLAILGEEFGELCEASLHNRFGGSERRVERMQEECVQVVAVGLAMLQCLTAKTWKWPALTEEAGKGG